MYVMIIFCFICFFIFHFMHLPFPTLISFCQEILIVIQSCLLLWYSYFISVYFIYFLFTVMAKNIKLSFFFFILSLLFFLYICLITFIYLYQNINYLSLFFYSSLTFFYSSIHYLSSFYDFIDLLFSDFNSFLLN